MALTDRLRGLPVIGTAVRVQERYQDDAADQLAASIGLFGFLSLFPLVALAVAVGGYLVSVTPGADVDVAQAIEDAIPGLSGLRGTDAQDLVTQVAANAGAIAGVGALTLLYAGLRVVTAAMVATSRVFRIARPKGWRSWVRKVGALGALGALALLGAASSGAAGVTELLPLPGPLQVAVGTAVTFGFDLLLFLVAYRILAAADGPPWRRLLPGAVLAAMGWTALKIVGSTWVAGQVARANELYGVFAGIIALLLLFYLAGRLYLYGAELAAVLGDAADHVGDGGAAGGGHGGDRDRPATTTGAMMDRTAASTDTEDGPPPPPAIGPDDPSPAVSRATRARLVAADAARPAGRTPVRHAVAFSLAVGVVGGLTAAWKPWEQR